MKATQIIARVTIATEPRWENNYQVEYITMDEVFNSHNAMRNYMKYSDKELNWVFGHVVDGLVYWTANISWNTRKVVEAEMSVERGFEYIKPQFHNCSSVDFAR